MFTYREPGWDQIQDQLYYTTGLLDFLSTHKNIIWCSLSTFWSSADVKPLSDDPAVHICYLYVYTTISMLYRKVVW
jgi:hypothetical protein